MAMGDVLLALHNSGANVLAMKSTRDNRQPRTSTWSGDILEEKLLPAASIVVMYLYDDLIKQVLPKLGGAHTIVSISHQMPRVKQTRYVVAGTNVYIFRKGQ